MASNYPTSIDSFTDPLSNSPLNNPSHSAQHQDLNDAVEKLETKLGVGSSPASSATNGQLLVKGATNTTWQPITSVSSGAAANRAVLAADGSGAVAWNANVGMWNVGTFTAAGTNRALVCDNVFTSDFDNYRVVGKLRSTVNTNNLFFQLLDTSGATISSGYYSTIYGQDYSTAGTAFTTLNGLSVGYVGWLPNSSALYVTFAFDIIGPRIAADCTSWAGQHTGISSGSAYLGGQLLGARTVAAAERGLRFDNGGAGNLTGTVRVYGYNNG